VDNNKMYLKGGESVDWIQLVLDKGQWRASMDTARTLWIS